MGDSDRAIFLIAQSMVKKKDTEKFTMKRNDAIDVIFYVFAGFVRYSVFMTQMYVHTVL